MDLKNLIPTHCPLCNREWHHASVCPECQEKRRQAILAREQMYPSCEELGLNPIGPGKYEIPVGRYRRSHSSGRRVVRKAEPMAG